MSGSDTGGDSNRDRDQEGMEVTGEKEGEENRFTGTRNVDIEIQGTDNDTGIHRHEETKGQKSRDTVRWIGSFQRLREGDSKKRARKSWRETY